MNTLLKQEISLAVLILLGYQHNEIFGYLCPPQPANGSTYRLENKTDGIKMRWRAFLGGHEDNPTIRWLDTIEELNDFHKGMCGKELVNS